ncbi:NAD-dependent epimerase/dehydratase family protein [Neobacillus drentensis]|uniref:NAD-dependent epimerase/dehydratase family protein n=1 Tax=Neobacillus drentensis TaxID=220684 RepID=UPI00300221C0
MSKVIVTGGVGFIGSYIVEELPLTITHPTQPESTYGLSKLSVENYLKMSSKLYQLPYSILRYSNVYGPRQDSKGEGGVVAIFSNQLTENRAPVIYGDGEQTRDFIFVKDVASANVKALNAKENINVHVSSGSCISINELFEKMKEATGSNLSPIYIREFLFNSEFNVLNENFFSFEQK